MYMDVSFLCSWFAAYSELARCVACLVIDGVVCTGNACAQQVLVVRAIFILSIFVVWLLRIATDPKAKVE